MFAYTWHECPHCGFEIEVEIEINETDGDLPDNCPECGNPIGDGDFASDATGKLTDAAHDAAMGD